MHWLLPGARKECQGVACGMLEDAGPRQDGNETTDSLIDGCSARSSKADSASSRGGVQWTPEVASLARVPYWGMCAYKGVPEFGHRKVIVFSFCHFPFPLTPSFGHEHYHIKK